MKKTPFIVTSILLVVFSCSEHQQAARPLENDPVNKYKAVVIAENNATQTVDLSQFTLIEDPVNDRRKDAQEILQVKRKWPLAMQSLDPTLFDSILSKGFTFKSGDAFYNRADYIKNRTAPDEWKITFVRYDHVTLQFMGETGILSYVNHITNKNALTGAVEYEHISWVDMYVKEGGKWKIAAAHAIDYRLEEAGK